MNAKKTVALMGICAVCAGLAGCGQGAAGAGSRPAAVAQTATAAVPPDTARAVAVLDKLGYQVTANKPAADRTPDRMEFSDGANLIRLTWQESMPILAESFPDEAQLPGGETYRYQITGYGAVSCLFERQGRAVILTVLPPASAIATASVDVTPVMKPEQAASLAKQLS